MQLTNGTRTSLQDTALTWPSKLPSVTFMRSGAKQNTSVICHCVRLPISTPSHSYRSIGLACTRVISHVRTRTPRAHMMHWYVALIVHYHEAQCDVQHANRNGQRQSTLSGSMVQSSTARVVLDVQTHFSCICGCRACSSGSDGLQQRQSTDGLDGAATVSGSRCGGDNLVKLYRRRRRRVHASASGAEFRNQFSVGTMPQIRPGSYGSAVKTKGENCCEI